MCIHILMIKMLTKYNEINNEKSANLYYISVNSSVCVQCNRITLQLVLLTALLFCTLLPQALERQSTSDLFDTFAVDNYIKKYCRGKQ